MALKCSLPPQITNKESMEMDKKRRVISCDVNDGTPLCKITGVQSRKCDGFTSADEPSWFFFHKFPFRGDAAGRVLDPLWLLCAIAGLKFSDCLTLAGEEIRVKQDKREEKRKKDFGRRIFFPPSPDL